MLAVSCVRGDGREGRVLQVWVRNNWHWYLKHERVYEACEGALHIRYAYSGIWKCGVRSVILRGFLPTLPYTN